MPAAVAAGQTVALQVTGRCGVPGSGVAAVVLTVTVVAPQCSGYITVSPAGVLRQPISDLTFPSGVTIAKTVTVPVGANGRIDLFNGSAGEVHVVVDLTGYTASVEQRGFSWSIRAVDAQLAARMTTSWQPGCPVPLSGLRLLTVTHRCFDGADHVGELVVAAAVAPDVVQIFHELYDHRFPIASLRLVDDFGGSGQSMAANNSSAFNCQPAIGGTGFSEHSFGTAIDLNPIQNPYVAGNVVLPDQGRAFLARTPAPGVIRSGDAVVTAFTRIGWSWGGSRRDPIDYQHFSATGR